MSSADWNLVVDSLDAATVAKGATGGYPRPNGGGAFCYGFNSIVAADGAVAFYSNQATFNPFAPAKGGSISGALVRGASAGGTDFSCFLALLMQGTQIDDNAYLIGLEDADPARIVLRKGDMRTGIPGAILSGTGKNALMASTASYDLDEWVHIRADAILEPSGDVLIQLFQNDLGAHAVSAPVWVAIPGAEEFIDDALGVASGSVPYITGRGGFGFQCGSISRRAYVDYTTLQRQT